jgi:nucleotide-binding universal stress UspA family protein
MEKIVMIMNAHKPDIKSIDFACRIAALSNAKLTGFFMETTMFTYIPVAETEYPSYFEIIKEKGGAEVLADTEQAVTIFKGACQRKGVNAKTYVDKGNPVQEIIFESRFVDLLIVDPAISIYDKQEQLPSHFVKEILSKAECPVMLAPLEFDYVEEIIFCYDDSASSVFAIKQFSYLFPEFRSKKVTLLEVNKTGNQEFNESHRRVMDWLRAHYLSVCYHALDGEVKNELFTYLIMKSRKIIVMGAYGRSLLSNFFKRSSADILIRSVDLPIFITHH